MTILKWYCHNFLCRMEKNERFTAKKEKRPTSISIHFSAHLQGGQPSNYLAIANFILRFAKRSNIYRWLAALSLTPRHRDQRAVSQCTWLPGVPSELQIRTEVEMCTGNLYPMSVWEYICKHVEGWWERGKNWTISRLPGRICKAKYNCI